MYIYCLQTQIMEPAIDFRYKSHSINATDKKALCFNHAASTDNDSTYSLLASLLCNHLAKLKLQLLCGAFIGHFLHHLLILS